MSGATPAAIAAYDQAVFAFQNWRRGADDHVATALREAPDFVMAHALQAYMLVCTRDPDQVRSARPVVERLSNLPASDRERLHFSALAAVVGDDYEGAKSTSERSWISIHAMRSPCTSLIRSPPTGDIECLNERVAAVLPAWSSELVGYSAVLAMHAFGLEEAGEFQRAERTALAALALDGANARAHRDGAHLRNDRSARGRSALVERAQGPMADGYRGRHTLLVASGSVPPFAGGL